MLSRMSLGDLAFIASLLLIAATLVIPMLLASWRDASTRRKWARIKVEPATVAKPPPTKWDIERKTPSVRPAPTFTFPLPRTHLDDEEFRRTPRMRKDASTPRPVSRIIPKDMLDEDDTEEPTLVGIGWPPLTWGAPGSHGSSEDAFSLVHRPLDMVPDVHDYHGEGGQFGGAGASGDFDASDPTTDTSIDTPDDGEGPSGD
jgi:hypothetical protein